MNTAYENLLDVGALIDYMLVVFYLGDMDGPIIAVAGWGPIRSSVKSTIASKSGYPTTTWASSWPTARPWPTRLAFAPTRF